MFARLTTKAEKREKDRRAYDQRPAEHLEAHSCLGEALPNEACDLIDHGILAFRVGPALPRFDTRLCIERDVKRRQRNGPKYLDGRNAHQAEVSALTETGGR